MRKRYIILGILIFLSGIMFISSGLLLNHNKKGDKENFNKLLVFDFKYSKIQDEDNNKGLILNFILLNNTDKDIESDTLKFKFYNKNKLIHEFDYQIENLRIKEEFKIEYQEMFEYQDIDNYEIIYNNEKIKVLNYEEWKKENIKDDINYDDYQIGKSEIKISNVKFDDTDEGIELSLEIENVGEELITNQILKIDFYKEDKIIYTFEHTIEELAPEVMQVIKPNLEIKKSDFDNYEITYNDKVINKSD